MRPDRQASDEAALVVLDAPFPPGSSAALGCRRNEAPRHEEQVTSPGVQRGGTREKRVAESITHLADTKLVTALRLGEKVDNLPHAALVLTGGVQPGDH